MCLGVPGQIISIEGDDPLLRFAVVDFEGVTRKVSLACTPEAKLGDHCLVHVGIAIAIIRREDVAAIRAAWQEIDSIPEEDLP